MGVVRWQGDDTFDQDVVGESNYQTALRKLSSGERRKYLPARLVCESNNKFDPQAVRVEIGGQTVGHLSREDARSHRALLKKARKGGAIVELPAVIVTGEQGGCGVYLSVTEDDLAAMMVAKPASVVTRLTDRILIGLVIVLACVGLTLMVAGFGSAGSGGVQPTPTMGKLSDYLKTHPIATVVP